MDYGIQLHEIVKQNTVKEISLLGAAAVIVTLFQCLLFLKWQNTCLQTENIDSIMSKLNNILKRSKTIYPDQVKEDNYVSPETAT